MVDRSRRSFKLGQMHQASNFHHNITDDEKSNGGEEGDGEGKLNGEHDEDERKRSAEVQQELIDSLQSKLDDSQTQIDTYQGEPAAVFLSLQLSSMYGICLCCQPVNPRLKLRTPYPKLKTCQTSQVFPPFRLHLNFTHSISSLIPLYS